jgi:hypothetical protein
MTCGNFHHGSEKGTESVRFCANRGISATKTTMIQQAFRDQIIIRTQVFQWHSSVQYRSHISWRWRTQGEKNKLHKFWNYCTNSRARPSGSKSDHSQHCLGGGNWLWGMVTSSDKRIGYVCSSQICACDPSSWLEAAASFWQNKKWLSPLTNGLPWFDTMWLLPIYKNETEAESTPVSYHKDIQGDLQSA